MFATSMGLLPCATPVQSPESNGMAEGFINTFKRDYVHINRLETTVQVLAQLPTWFEDCNEIHPHRGLKMRSPREYRKSLSAASNAVEKYEHTGIVVYQASDPVGYKYFDVGAAKSATPDSIRYRHFCCCAALALLLS